MPYRRFRSAIRCGQAASVAARSPPPSCSRTIEPGRACGVHPVWRSSAAVGFVPVLRVDVPVQRPHAELAGHRHHLRRPPAARLPEERDLRAGHRRAGSPGWSRAGRPGSSATGRRAEVDVVPPAVVAELWPSRTIRRTSSGWRCTCAADHAERRVDPGRPQLVEHLRRPGRVRARRRRSAPPPCRRCCGAARPASLAGSGRSGASAATVRVGGAATAWRGALDSAGGGATGAARRCRAGLGRSRPRASDQRPGRTPGRRGHRICSLPKGVGVRGPHDASGPRVLRQPTAAVRPASTGPASRRDGRSPARPPRPGRPGATTPAGSASARQPGPAASTSSGRRGRGEQRAELGRVGGGAGVRPHHDGRRTGAVDRLDERGRRAPGRRAAGS